MFSRKNSEPATPKTGSSIPRPPARRLVAVQGLLGLAMSLAALYFGGYWEFRSALAGMLVALLPNLVFVAIAFRHTGARAAQLAIGDLYLAEACKFLLTVIMFALVFAFLQPLAPEWVFASYIAALSAYWLGPWLVTRRPQTNRVCGQVS